MSTLVSFEQGESAIPDAEEDRAESPMVALARELVDKVGTEGAIRYCHSVGWRGVLAQVELLRGRH